MYHAVQRRKAATGKSKHAKILYRPKRLNSEERVSSPRKKNQARALSRNKQANLTTCYTRKPPKHKRRSRGDEGKPRWRPAKRKRHVDYKTLIRKTSKTLRPRNNGVNSLGPMENKKKTKKNPKALALHGKLEK